jgi:ATP-dependent helicase/nuclease subunit A
MSASATSMLRAAVVASAGTGKTYTLVQEYLASVVAHASDDVSQPLPVLRIAAITFTDKAAHELQHRLDAAFVDAANHPPAGTTAAQWRMARQQLPRAPVSTIHALCRRLLLQVEPAVEILQPSDAKALGHEVAERVVRDALQEDFVVVSGLAARVPLTAQTRRGLLDWLVATQDRSCEERLEVMAPAHVPLVQRFAHAMAAIEPALLELRAASGGKGDGDTVRRRVLEQQGSVTLQRWQRWQQSPDARAQSMLVDALREMRTHAAVPFGSRDVGLARQVVHAAVDAACAAFVDEQGHPPAQAAHKLWERYRREFDAICRRRGVMTFGQLLKRCHEAMVSDHTVRNQWKRRFHRLLVDEFQDCSPLQAECIAMLAEPLQHTRQVDGTQPFRSLDVSSDRLFVVGDAKQSIYGFRGAQAGLFEHTCAQLGGARSKLTVSRRSQASVCAFVNQVMNHHAPHWQDQALQPLPGLAPASAARAPAVQCCWLRIPEVDVRPPVLVELHHAARWIIERPAQHKGLAVLVRRGRAATLLASLLSQAGVAVVVSGGDGFFTRPEIVDAIGLLSLIIHPLDELAVLTVLRSPFVLCPDDDLVGLLEASPRAQRLSWPDVVEAARDELVSADTRARVMWLDALLQRLRAQLRRRSLSAVLHTLWDETEYLSWAGLPAPQRAHAQAQMDQLKQLTQGNAGDGVWMIQRLRMSVDDGHAQAESFAAPDGAVRIMTIHQAKGLEFEHVLVTDIGGPLPSNTDDIVVSAPGQVAVTPRGLAVAPLVPRSDSVAVTQLQQARATDRAAAKAEQLRLLYVAMTRARTTLSVIGVPRSSSSMIQLLQDATASTPSTEHWQVETQDAVATELPRMTAANIHAHDGVVFAAAPAPISRVAADALVPKSHGLWSTTTAETAASHMVHEGALLVLGLPSDVRARVTMESLWRALGNPMVDEPMRVWCERSWGMVVRAAGSEDDWVLQPSCTLQVPGAIVHASVLGMHRNEQRTRVLHVLAGPLADHESTDAHAAVMALDACLGGASKVEVCVLPAGQVRWRGFDNDQQRQWRQRMERAGDDG